ncbi:MAG: ArsC family reductase [Congregibacter sp.]
MAFTLYGISNCDTVRKAKRWLDDGSVDYRFHDLRVDGLDRATVKHWVDTAGWEQVLNRRSTSWRTLSQEDRDSIDAAAAIEHMLKVPTLVKRPVLEGTNGELEIGFKTGQYQALLEAHTMKTEI